MKELLMVNAGDILQDKNRNQYRVVRVHMNGDVLAIDDHKKTWLIERYELRKNYIKIA